MAGKKGAADLIGIPFIVKDQRMDVAVARVKDVWNAELIFAAALADKVHDRGEL